MDNGLTLGPLSAIDSAELLLKLTWRKNDVADRSTSLDLANKLRGLPLALTQFAGVNVRQDISFAELLRRYEEEETHENLFRRNMAPSRKRASYLHTLATVWPLDTLKQGTGLLEVIAFLDPNGIPEKILTKGLDTRQPSGYPKTLTEFQDAYTELLSSSLIAKNRSTSSYTVHRLIQDVTRARMRETLGSLTSVFVSAVQMLYELCTRADFGIWHVIARWHDCEQLSAYIETLRDHFCRAGAT